jgi:hypothetical protein
LIEKLFKGHFESVAIVSDKLAAPSSLIELLLYLNIWGKTNYKLLQKKNNNNKKLKMSFLKRIFS